MQFDLNHLTLRQLDSLIATAKRRLKVLTRRHLVAANHRKVQGLTNPDGQSTGDLLTAPRAGQAARPAKRKKAKVAPKYQNPEDRRQTWTGRGRTPRWLAEKVKRGQSTADFLIPGLARPTAKKASTIGRRSVFKQS